MSSSTQPRLDLRGLILFFKIDILCGDGVISKYDIVLAKADIFSFRSMGLYLHLPTKELLVLVFSLYSSFHPSSPLLHPSPMSHRNEVTCSLRFLFAGR